ncbi:Serpin-ZX [Capsicum annuum]|nr:Serpin-ZX [Capsicum annuum]KAF3677326.1 Serpin-ZX [Capsicum annuum]
MQLCDHSTQLAFFSPSSSSRSRASMDLQESITNQTDVTFMLTKHVFSEEVEGNSNMVLSPLSIQIVLGLIAAGSSGPTKDQLLHFLKSKSIDELNSLYSHILNTVFVDGSPNGGPRLSVANGIWIEQTLPFNLDFKQVVDNVYKATSESGFHEQGQAFIC